MNCNELADTYPTRQAATHSLCVTASKIDRQNNSNGLLAHLCGDNKDICPIKSIQGSFKFKKLEYPKEIEVSPTDSLGKQDSIAKLNDRNMTRFIEQEEAITLFKHMMVYGFLSEPEAITVLAGFPSIDNISSQKLFQRVIDLQQSTIDSRPRVLLKSPILREKISIDQDFSTLAQLQQSHWASIQSAPMGFKAHEQLKLAFFFEAIEGEFEHPTSPYYDVIRKFIASEKDPENPSKVTLELLTEKLREEERTFPPTGLRSAVSQSKKVSQLTQMTPDRSDSKGGETGEMAQLASVLVNAFKQQAGASVKKKRSRGERSPEESPTNPKKASSWLKVFKAMHKDQPQPKDVNDVPKGEGRYAALGKGYLRLRGNGADKYWYNCKFCTADGKGPQMHPSEFCFSNPQYAKIGKTANDMRKHVSDLLVEWSESNEN